MGREGGKEEVETKAGEKECLGVRGRQRQKSKAREGQRQRQIRAGWRENGCAGRGSLCQRDSWKSVCLCERAQSVTRGEVILSEGEGRKRWNLRRSCLTKKTKTKRHTSLKQTFHSSSCPFPSGVFQPKFQRFSKHSLMP